MASKTHIKKKKILCEEADFAPSKSEKGEFAPSNSQSADALYCGKLVLCIELYIRTLVECTCTRIFSFFSILCVRVRLCACVCADLCANEFSIVQKRKSKIGVDLMATYMDETGYVYSSSAKSNLHPTYTPKKSEPMTESGTYYSSLKVPVPSYLDSTNTISSAVNNLLHGSASSGSGGGSGGSSGGGGSSSSPFTIKNGKVQFTDPNMAAAMQMINEQAAANNAWSAEQAQKQMDFQKMMSDTAHQREVADLQAAGLNPVLSAGGSGAQVTSGAMGQTDDSNTRLIAELALGALEAIGNTAVGVAGATSSKKSGLIDNYFVRRFLGGVSSTSGAVLGRQLMTKAVGLFV